jgi:hypothetical protein
MDRKMLMRKYLLLMTAMLCVALPGAASFTLGKTGPELTVVKQNIQIFEGILTTVLAQNFPDPFAVLEKPKGVYLEGFGTVFSFEIDIATVRPPNPFNPIRPTPEEERKAIAERLPKLKELMVKTLAEHADSMEFLGPDFQVAIVAQLFNSGFLSRPMELKTILVRTAKRNVLDFKAGRLNYEDFKKKIEIVQY